MNTTAQNIAAAIETITERVAGVATYQHVGHETGRKYVRLFLETKSTGSRSVFYFIDTTTGNILGAKGWKGPNRKMIIGNVNEDNFGWPERMFHGGWGVY